MARPVRLWTFFQIPEKIELLVLDTGHLLLGFLGAGAIIAGGRLSVGRQTVPFT